MATLAMLKLELLIEKRKELIKEMIDLELKAKVNGALISVDSERYEYIKKAINAVEDMLSGNPNPIEK